MERAAPPFPLFVSACVGSLCAVAWSPPWWGAALLAVALVLGLAFATSAALRALSLLGLAGALALAAGSATVASHQASQARLPRGAAVFEGIADEVTDSRSGGKRVVLDATGVLDGAGGVPLRARLEVLAPAGSDPVLPGDRLRVSGVARRPAPADLPGELDGALLALSRGVDARVSLRDPSALAVLAHGAAWRPFASTRLWLSEQIQARATPHEAGLLLALLVGDTALLDDAERALYRDVGAGHLLAVSGLQVSLLALLLRALFAPLLLLWPAMRAGRGARTASVLALVVVWAFVLVCGAPPSATRAGAMATAVLAAGLLSRRARGLDALGVGGLVTVLLSPVSVVDPSFLLSYGAVLGLVFAPRLTEPDATLGRRLLAALVTTVAAGVLTLPLSALLFGQVAPGGLLANVVLVPAASVLQVPALVCGALGAALHSGTLLHVGGEAALLLEALVAGLGGLLGGLSFVEGPGPVVSALLVVMATVVLVLMGRRRFAAAGGLALAAAALLWLVGRPPSGVRITVVPVGQGDASLFEFPDGTRMLVDGGGVLLGPDPGDNVLVPFLRRRGVDKIDVMVLSHPHPDHGNGLAAVARAFPVGALWHNGAPPSAPVLAPLLAALPPGTPQLTTPAILGVHRFGEVTVEVLAPAPVERTPQYPELSANDNSLVLRICLGAGDAAVCALWPGDVEALGEELLLEGAPVRAAVVKAPHHGSSTSSSPALVAHTDARDVIFCTGRDNTFFFPHQQVLERWRGAGARLWDTAAHGQITVVLRPDGARVSAHHAGVVEAPPEG